MKTPDPFEPRPPRDARPHGRRLMWRLVVLGVALGLILLGLWSLYSPATWRAGNGVFLARDLAIGGFLVLALAVSRLSLRSMAGQLGLWLAILLLIVAGYSYREELGGVAGRIAANLMPARGTAIDAHSIAFPAASDGQYRIDATVDGIAVRFLLDTGASGLVLNRRDAERLGFDLSELSFTQMFDTANGRTRGAPVTLSEVRIGPIVVDHVAASVNEGELGESLLGMRFLERLAEVNIRNGVLTIRQE